MMRFVNLDDVPQVLELTKRERSPGLPAIMLAGLAAGYPLGGSDLKTCTKCLHWVWRGGNYASAFVIAQGSLPTSLTSSSPWANSVAVLKIEEDSTDGHFE